MAETNTIINDVLRTWAVEFAQNRVAGARAAGLDAAGDLIQSVRHEISDALAQIQRFSYAMNDYGRILEMRSPKWTKLPKVAEIEEWVKSIGVDKFRSAQRKGKGPQDANLLANSIAWGVAKNIVKRQKFKRRRRWYAKAAFEDIGTLYERLLDALSTNTLTEVKSGFGTVLPKP